MQAGQGPGTEHLSTNCFPFWSTGRILQYSRRGGEGEASPGVPTASSIRLLLSSVRTHDTALPVALLTGPYWVEFHITAHIIPILEFN
jgi:hypothetical protein